MENKTTNFNKTLRSDVYKIDPKAIKVVAGFNSRSDFGDIEELASQIAEQGVLNPISVKKISDTEYELVDGERRYRAVMWLINHGTDVARVPALVLPKNLNTESMLLQQIMRNEGKPFNEYEYGVAYQKLSNLGFTNEEISKKVGKHRWHIDCCLSHLRRDERVQELLRTNQIKGTEVRRVYQAHKGDEEGAVKEIITAMNLRDEKAKTTNSGDNKEKKSITIGDLDALQSRTIAKRDTATIKKGLNLLLKYYTQISENGTVRITFNPKEIVKRLNNDVDLTIIDLFNELKENSVKAVG